MFEHDKSVERTYHIWIPPGPVVAGYAIEACWEPPTVTPVTNPLTDFPISANQPEPYIHKMIVNNDEPVTDCDSCCWGCDYSRMIFKQWSEPICNIHGIWLPPPEHAMNNCNIMRWNMYECDRFGYEGWYKTPETIHPTCLYGNGTQRFLSVLCHYHHGQTSRVSWYLFDITNDDPDLD